MRNPHNDKPVIAISNFLPIDDVKDFSNQFKPRSLYCPVSEITSGV
jgi:hypothetical protein